MTTIRSDGTQVVLPRLGRDDFWEVIHNHYAGEDKLKWKYLAILALRENCGWPLEQIGIVFGHPRGHVSRILAKIKTELRDNFDRSPECLAMDDPDVEMEFVNSEFDPDTGFSDPLHP